MHAIVRLAIALSMFVAAPAPAATIDFDNLPTGSIVANQYPDATFATVPGAVVRALPAFAQFGASPPNLVCAGSEALPACDEDLFVTFAQPMTWISFLSVADNVTGTVAQVDIFGANGLLGSMPVVGDGDGLTSSIVNLAGYNNVTSLQIRDIVDPGGLGFDNFSFRPSRVSIDFDELLDGAIIGDRYGAATFTSTGETAVRAIRRDIGTSLPNFVCPISDSGDSYCTEDLIVTFADPVEDVSFMLIGDSGPAVTAYVDVFGPGGLVATATVIGDSNSTAPLPVVLSPFLNVTSIRVRGAEGAPPRGFDDFVFTISAIPVPASAISEPGSAMVALLGLAALAVRRRLRLHGKAA